MSEDAGVPLAIEILLVLMLLAAVQLVRDARRVQKPRALMRRGLYAEARAANDRLARTWMRVLPGVRNGARYGAALARHMLGDFEGSLAALAALDPPIRGGGGLLYAAKSLEASNLVLLGRDFPRAAALLEDAAKLEEMPEDLLFLAHARHGLGDVAGAEDLLDRASRLDRRPADGDRAHHGAIVHTMRGLLLVKLGRPDEALRDFKRAAAVPLDNWYTARARALLPRPGGETDPRSSLAPQILE